ncbi:MAG: hypothetical protein ACP5I4_11070 [Oceanipulchritudo sp.]
MQMRIFNLFPWRWVVRRIARRQGFLDPLELLARLRRFSQPSEVQEPIELIRAGMVFHARGLLNTKVIQNNLDWIWPYWIVRQFSPEDHSFIPRAFSFSHVNLTHRNWTALGVPGCLELPVVDPRGMVTPHHDDWSVDHWFVADNGEHLFPSALVEAGQRLLLGARHTVETTCANASAEMVLQSEVRWIGGHPFLSTEITLGARVPGRLVVSVRPCNPEGIQFIEDVAFGAACQSLEVGSTHRIEFGEAPGETFTSDYAHGDVLSRILSGETSTETACPAGLATAAASFRVGSGEEKKLEYRMRLFPEEHPAGGKRMPPPAPSAWETRMAGWSCIEVPDTRFGEIFESGKRTLALLSQTEILPGPYTYRRFWFRDACLIGNALLGLNRDDLVRRALDGFPGKQHLDGYFHSQEGEWDSNGQVLWLADRFERLAGPGKEGLGTEVLHRAARWIDRKRRRTAREDAQRRGLLPAGFSAEHLGPNDFYYWDDFWGAAGLRAAEAIFARRNEREKAEEAGRMAAAFEADILRSIGAQKPERVGRAIPAAPGRRMDSGAVGSMVADYPLQLEWVPRGRLLATANWLLEHSLHKGGFFQNMIHSGINAYLTLDLAQTLLRHGDPRYRDLLQAVASVASPTGKWPEAVHPQTGGGCMGDGEHAWAAAEWCQMMRSLFIMESGNTLLIGKGLPAQWLDAGQPMACGPTLTPWGRVRVHLLPGSGEWTVRLEADWHDLPPDLKICLPEKYRANLVTA